eukprot:gb/GEZN01008161.1/.p1 GENE.gb/GEZN01008161.1/~~gb/GEZN01008161.1/.p1  ORF type:complete len:457 (+),score=28.44 gb/GEZN01008161.1/:46-1371(+)
MTAAEMRNSPFKKLKPSSSEGNARMIRVNFKMMVTTALVTFMFLVGFMLARLKNSSLLNAACVHFLGPFAVCTIMGAALFCSSCKNICRTEGAVASNAKRCVLPKAVDRSNPPLLDAKVEYKEIPVAARIFAGGILVQRPGITTEAVRQRLPSPSAAAMESPKSPKRMVASPSAAAIESPRSHKRMAASQQPLGVFDAVERALSCPITVAETAVSCPIPSEPVPYRDRSSDLAAQAIANLEQMQRTLQAAREEKAQLASRKLENRVLNPAVRNSSPLHISSEHRLSAQMTPQNRTMSPPASLPRLEAVIHGYAGVGHRANTDSPPISSRIKARSHINTPQNLTPATRLEVLGDRILRIFGEEPSLGPSLDNAQRPVERAIPIQCTDPDPPSPPISSRFVNVARQRLAETPENLTPQSAVQTLSDRMHRDSSEVSSDLLATV